jgi:hypothetical protein
LKRIGFSAGVEQGAAMLEIASSSARPPDWVWPNNLAPHPPPSHGSHKSSKRKNFDRIDRIFSDRTGRDKTFKFDAFISFFIAENPVNPVKTHRLLDAFVAPGEGSEPDVPMLSDHTRRIYAAFYFTNIRLWLLA